LGASPSPGTPVWASGILRSVLWLSLGSWVGAWAFFGFVVSRLAFRTLPGDVAADMAGRLLEVLYYGGAVAALLSAGTAYLLGRRGVFVLLPIVLAVLCVASELWLSPAIAELRPSTLGAATSESSSRLFARLHALSMSLFLGIHLTSVLLLLLHAWRDARPDRWAGSSPTLP